MPTYKVVGTYHGKVVATVRAASLLDALKRLENAEEDELEIDEPSKFEYHENNVKQVP